MSEWQLKVSFWVPSCHQASKKTKQRTSENIVFIFSEPWFLHMHRENTRTCLHRMAQIIKEWKLFLLRSSSMPWWTEQQCIHNHLVSDVVSCSFGSFLTAQPCLAYTSSKEKLWKVGRNKRRNCTEQAQRPQIRSQFLLIRAEEGWMYYEPFTSNVIYSSFLCYTLDHYKY